jgi:hypothetical protein
MAFRFTDQHAMSLVAPLLFPGEQVLFRARGVEKPWYSTIFWKLGSLFWRYWLVVATNQRLVLVQHKGLLGGYGAKRNETFGWNELDQVALGWGIFNKTLRFKSAAKRFARSIIVPRWWMKGNFDAAQGAAGAWEQNRHSLPPASMPLHILNAPPSQQAQYGAPVY